MVCPLNGTAVLKGVSCGLNIQPLENKRVIKSRPVIGKCYGIPFISLEPGTVVLVETVLGARTRSHTSRAAAILQSHKRHSSGACLDRPTTTTPFVLILMHAKLLLLRPREMYDAPGAQLMFRHKLYISREFLVVPEEQRD